ncbi:MAG: SGNH/GDSL hydrolase family protein [Verrucomicrobiota bacterium]
MKQLHTLLGIFFIALLAFPLAADEEKYVPEPGSDELKKGARKKVEVDPSLPNVLIIGDSISNGYTPPARKALEGIANVLHNPGNAQGTTYGLAKIDEWLEAMEWEVIHFNFGLHDLKRVIKAGTSQNSNDPNDPYQADRATYEANLKKIVTRLKETDAYLIFATTTPFPAGVKPFRSPKDAGNYNEVAVAIMEANGIEINDLHGLVLPDLKTLQKPVNVHFLPEGSELMGNQVAERIRVALETK